MEAIGQLFSGLSLLILAVGAGAFMISISIAGVYYVTAFGDPQKISVAKGALMSSILGILIMAFAPIAPRVLNQVVFEPAGLGGVVTVSGTGCDQTLKTALLTQRSVNTAKAVNSMISQIQSQRSDDCGATIWDPAVIGTGFIAGTTGSDSGPGVAQAFCGFKGTWAQGSQMRIGNTDLSPSLTSIVHQRTGTTVTQGGFARDAVGSMLVEFATASRPTDGSQCWVYMSQGNFWDEQA